MLLDITRKETETRILEEAYDFSASYMAVHTLTDHIASRPESVTKKTVHALISLLTSRRFETQRQVFFLYREAAQTLLAILYNTRSGPEKLIIPSLTELLFESCGRCHRAVAEALGSLPIDSRGPAMPKAVSTEVPPQAVTFKNLIREMDFSDPENLTWQGRSLTGPCGNGSRGVIKFARRDETPLPLFLESWWMEHLEARQDLSPGKLPLPTPFTVDGVHLLHVQGLPSSPAQEIPLHHDGLAIAFFAPGDYYHYPNGAPAIHAGNEIREIFIQNAHILGAMTARGIVHTALIPLFHNRVQQSRREDMGIYDWERGGRLDQWLDSCRHPNFSISGPRDFEHFESGLSPREIHHHMGAHLLSLILVAGSIFRNRHPEMRGVDKEGKPVDTRHLFDRSLFSELIKSSITAYHRGFTGREPREFFTDLPRGLLHELITAMGQDRDMEEILRVDDQGRMTQEEFENFLGAKGMPKKKISSHTKGKEEIAILTGPHLGGFNQRISTPLLIDYVFTCCSLFMSERYAEEQGLGGVSVGLDHQPVPGMDKAVHP